MASEAVAERPQLEAKSPFEMRIHLGESVPDTDVKSALYAGRFAYRKLLAAGVRVFEYVPTVLHAKSVVADGCFAAVGTMNFDNRSMVFNDETMLLVYDDGVACEVERLFERDLEHSREITREVYAQRSGWERLKQRVWWSMRRVL